MGMMFFLCDRVFSMFCIDPPSWYVFVASRKWFMVRLSVSAFPVPLDAMNSIMAFRSMATLSQACCRCCFVGRSR